MADSFNAPRPKKRRRLEVGLAVLVPLIAWAAVVGIAYRVLPRPGLPDEIGLDGVGQIGDTLSGIVGVLAVIGGNVLLYLALTVQVGELGEQKKLRAQQVDVEHRARIDDTFAHLESVVGSVNAPDDEARDAAAKVAVMTAEGVRDGDLLQRFKAASQPEQRVVRFVPGQQSYWLDFEHSLGALAAYCGAASSIQQRNDFRRVEGLLPTGPADLQRLYALCSPDLIESIAILAEYRAVHRTTPMRMYRRLGLAVPYRSLAEPSQRAGRAYAMMEQIWMATMLDDLSPTKAWGPPVAKRRGGARG
ncbi:MAG: hypothetical protein AAFU73_23430 [Planctomycetota bacterium]